MFLATLGMIPIADRRSEFDSGAAFLCAQKCTVSEVVCLDSGAEVEVRGGNPYVVARVRGPVNPTDAFNRAHEATQQSLDHLAIAGKAILSIRNASEEYVVWWREDAEQILRLVWTGTMSFKMDISCVATDGAGNLVPPPPPPKLIYSESLRYFRLSQVTEDLFDAFRNMYLALELLLEHTCPKRRGSEGEGTWLRRALAEVNERVSLSQAYRTTESNIIDDIYNNLYTNLRCRLFHAKHGSRLVPQNLADRSLVSEGLDKLTRVFLLLARELLNARPRGGGVSYEGFALMTEPLMSGSILLVSDNDMPLDASATLKSPPFVGAIPMLTRAAPELSCPGLGTVLGSVGAVELQGLRKIARVGLSHDGRLVMSGAIDTDLLHDGIDRVEVQIGMQLRNAKNPKKLFNT